MPWTFSSRFFGSRTKTVTNARHHFRGRAAKSTAASEDEPNQSATRSEAGRLRRCLDERLSPLVLSHYQLICRRGLSGIPHMTLHSTPRVHRWRLSPLAMCPHSLFPLVVAARSRRHFSPTPANPLRLVHAARPEDAAMHLSHWASSPQRTFPVSLGRQPVQRRPSRSVSRRGRGAE